MLQEGLNWLLTWVLLLLVSGSLWLTIAIVDRLAHLQ